MTLKKIATSVGVVLSALACSAYADVNSQLASLQAQVNQLQSQVNANGANNNMMAGVIGINPALSWEMMSNQGGVGKELNILKARQAGNMATVTVGGEFQGDAVYDHTNTNGKFSNPVVAGYEVPGGSNMTRLAITNGRLAVTASVGNWATAYMQLGQSNVGASTDYSTSFGIQDAYVVLGNLSQAPVYGFVGRKDIDFGNFATVDMYNQPLTRTLFEATGNTAGIGFNGYGFNGTFSLMNGGKTDSKTYVGSAIQYENLNSSNKSNIDNFAFNASYGMTSGSVAWDIGAGYLNGSSFLNQDGQTNGAWDINGKMSVAGFDLLAEYVATTSDTDHYGNNGNTHVAQAWTLGGDYNFPIMGYKSVVNLEYSQAYIAQGGNNQATQYVLGYRIQPINNVWTGLEYSYSKNLFNLGSVNAAGSGDVNNSTVVLDITAMF